VSNHPFVPLRHREVRLLWSAAVISDIGTWVQLIVVGSLVAAHTGSAVQTGLVALATFMPQGIASPVGGLLADRYDRRKVFAWALMAQAIATSGLAVVLGLGVRTPLVLTLLILVGSAAGATGAPSYGAMQPDLVPPDELMAMVSLGVYSWNSGRIVGPILGTLLALWVGPAWTVGFNAATFVVMAIAVSFVRRPFMPHGDADPDASVRVRLVEGWRALRATPGCFHGVALLVLFNLTIVPFMGLIPIYVRAAYGGGTGMAGTVASAQGLGAIVGGIAVTVLAARYSRSTVMRGLIIVLPTMLIAYAVAPSVRWLLPAAFLLGGCASAMFITSSAIVQRDAPPASRGRIVSIMQAAMGVCYGIGLLVIGSIGDLTNLHIAFTVGAVLMVVGFTALTMRSRHWRRAIDGGPIAVVNELVPA
jgi:MFS family permease